MSQAQAEAAVESLLDKHQKWLIQQPELLLLWTQGRDTRRRVAKMLATELMTIPAREFNETSAPSRAMRRAIMQELKRDNPTWWE
jgi:hypothetical protein